jgi:hypothetical protein
MSLGNSTVKDRFGDLLIVDNSGSGLNTNKQTIKDGNGQSSALQISDDEVLIKPQSDNTTTSLDIKNTSGSSVFSVNTSAQTVLAMSNVVNSGCFEFNSYDLSLSANTWTPLAYGNGSLISGTDDNNMGTSSSPATTFDVSTDSIKHAVSTYAFLPYTIVITDVKILFVGDSSSSDNIEFSLNAFALDSNTGDLSSGTILYSKSAAAYDNTKMYISDLSATTTTASAGNILLFMAKQNGTNNDLHAKVYVKYYIKG